MTKKYSVRETLEILPSVSTRTEKFDIVNNCKNVEVLKKMFYYTYNTKDINYHLKNVDLDIHKDENKSYLDITVPDGWTHFEKLLDRLMNRKVTGNKAREELYELSSNYDEFSVSLIEKILNRKLDNGFSTSSINEVFPNLIPVFDVALAEKFEGKNVDKVKMDGLSWLVSIKIDGTRMVVEKKDGEYSFYSRKGKPITTANNLIPELDKITNGIDNIVFDGELTVLNDKGKEDFTLIMNVLRKKDSQIDKPVYMIFDCLTTKEFYSGQSSRTFLDRYEYLTTLFDDGETYDNLLVLKQKCLTEEVFLDMKSKVDVNGWEGLMIRKNTGYKSGRSSDILKVKKFYDDEYEVLETINDNMVFTTSGVGQETVECLSSVVIKHKGFVVKVGSGFNKEQRIYYYNHPEEIIGKVITVQYFEETKNKKGELSLRFPTLKVIHGETREY